MSEAIVIVCIFLGILTRTLLPALRKWKEAIDSNEPFTWNHKYTITLIVSGIFSVVTALTLYESFVAPVASDTKIFIAAFFFGLGLNSGIDELAEWVTDLST